MAALLGLVEWIGRRRQTLADLQVGDGAVAGLAQALALVPDVSRSGSTITSDTTHIRPGPIRGGSSGHHGRLE